MINSEEKNECGICEKTEDMTRMYYVEECESETHANMILCGDCFEGLVQTGEIVPYERGEEIKGCEAAGREGKPQ